MATSTFLEYPKEDDTDQDLLKLEKVVLLQDCILLLSLLLKSDVWKHQRLGDRIDLYRAAVSAATTVQQRTVLLHTLRGPRTPAQLCGLPLGLCRGTPPATCSLYGMKHVQE